MRAALLIVLLGCSSSTTEAPASIDDTATVAETTTTAEDTATTPIDTSTPATDTTPPMMEAAVDTSMPATYPAGPYGTNVGNVIADLALEGYLRFETTGLATSATYAPTSFGELRTKSPRKHALIHVSGFT